MKSHLPLLDPLRFGAALGVAIFHQMFWSWAWVSIGVPGFERHVAADVLYPSAAPYAWFGWVGVEIFFVISGFVIANSASQTSPGAFLVGRALRLYPAVWVCATATFLVLLLFGSGPASETILPYIHAMLMVPKGVTGQWLDEVYWTLAAETAFYGLVFCAMLTKKITLRHLAFGLTIYSAIFNAAALAVLSCTTSSDLPYLVILMFRVPCAAFLLTHGCFFALGIWLFISANRELTALEQIAVAATCLAGAAEIYFFASFLLTSVPAIADQSALVPVAVWAAAVLLIALAAKCNRQSADIAPVEAPAYLRTLGLITYPLYLTHNVIGAAIIRALVDSGLDATSALWIALGLLVLVCWFICVKIEPAVRSALMQALSHFGKLPRRQPASRRPALSRGLRLPVPVKVKVATSQP
ncbi:acyltransferase family protein [Bradyrhizobium sp. 1(2017)]|uniref:acyltransferase family protein n=1 Tax=Bradyrhizobium sp. 1(2017) TaxID=1404888 RepID=UPI00140F2EA1|nr:acyltransferase [Bradyrhizobium sp. 1(2017)]QIO33487.1 acyltransferase [Bradyrhizobium sp. 1(2017)]